jgi:hypothetical protein
MHFTPLAILVAGPSGDSLGGGGGYFLLNT